MPTTLRSVALVAMVALSACSKKDDDTPAPAATTYATTWTADGTNYTATASQAQVSNGVLSVIGSQVTGSNNYSVTFGVPAAAGTYNVVTGSNAAGFTKTVNGTTTSYGAAASYGGSGTVVVTTYSATEVIGTFSFTLVNATTGGTAGNGSTITNGKFAIKR